MSKQKQFLKPLSIALGTTFAISMAASNIATAAPAGGDNPFAMSELESGYMQVAGKNGKDGKCGEGKCGEGKKHDSKGKDGKCGESKKGKDGKCGEGKCGGDKKGKDGKDGKCGEGKCGGKK